MTDNGVVEEEQQQQQQTKEGKEVTAAVDACGLDVQWWWWRCYWTAPVPVPGASGCSAGVLRCTR
jgi:hypothetical protein